MKLKLSTVGRRPEIASDATFAVNSTSRWSIRYCVRAAGRSGTKRS
jgi:hypothetical protein